MSLPDSFAFKTSRGAPNIGPRAEALEWNEAGQTGLSAQPKSVGRTFPPMSDALAAIRLLALSYPHRRAPSNTGFRPAE
jgi:hypothetical protein